MNIRKLECGVVCIAAMFAVVRSEASSFLDGLATNANKIAASNYASGGDIIWRIGHDYIHIFTNTAASATFTPAEAMSVRVLMVGGGGGGGTNCGGGGGAGGMVETNGLELAANTSYTITVGAGAAAKSGGEYTGNNGGDSTFKQGGAAPLGDFGAALPLAAFAESGLAAGEGAYALVHVARGLASERVAQRDPVAPGGLHPDPDVGAPAELPELGGQGGESFGGLVEEARRHQHLAGRADGGHSVFLFFDIDFHGDHSVLLFRSDGRDVKAGQPHPGCDMRHRQATALKRESSCQRSVSRMLNRAFPVFFQGFAPKGGTLMDTPENLIVRHRAAFWQDRNKEKEAKRNQTASPFLLISRPYGPLKAPPANFLTRGLPRDGELQPDGRSRWASGRNRSREGTPRIPGDDPCPYASMKRVMLFAAALLALAPCVADEAGARSLAAGDLRAYSMVTRDGRRLVSRVDGGGKTVYDLVATNSLPADLPPVRQWTIYGIKSAHSDLGLHRSNYAQRKGTVRRLEMAKNLFAADRRTDADPAAFRYVQEGWWGWFNFLADRGEETARTDFADILKRGRLDIGLSLCGSTTHIFGYEELARSLYPLRELRTKWGVAGHTSQLVDNPGVSCAVIDPYVEAGIENLTFWPNGWVPELLNSGRSPHRTKIRFAPGTDHPPVFWWEAKSGNRLLVWSGSHYIGGGQFGLSTAFVDKLSHPWPEKAELPPPGWRPDMERMERATAATLAYLEKTVPYDVWLFPDYHDDELPSTRLADAFAKWNEKWATPTVRTVGRLDEPFERLRAKFAEDIPVVRGDISCAWDRTLPAAAELLADKLAADRLLPLAEARAAVAAVRHGTAYPHDDLAHGYEALLLNDDHSYGFSGYSGRRCYDTWMQHRDWIETADRIASRSVGCAACSSLGVPCPVGASENRWYRIEVNERGEIVSIYDKELGRELLDGVANRLLYTRDGYRTWSDPAMLGGRVVQKVSLDPNEKRIVVENTISDAADLWNTNRFYRYGHYAFPFKVENPRFYSQLNGPVVDAHEGVTPHAQDTFSCIRDWCAVENGEFGVALVQPDTCIVEYGELHTTNAYCRLGRPKSGHVYPHVFADGLQYQLDRPPSFRFRFILTSYAGTWRDAHIPAFAAQQVGALGASWGRNLTLARRQQSWNKLGI